MASSIPENSFSNALAAVAPAAEPAPARSAQRAAGRGAADGVPFSNTGRKVDEDPTQLADETLAASTSPGHRQPGFELDGEWVRLLTYGHKAALVSTPLPNPQGVRRAALIDWLAFTIRPPENETHVWVIRELQRLNLVGVVEELSGGYAGYTHKSHYQDQKTRLCLIAWGGRQQAATVYVSFPGHGCARITNWDEVSEWLEVHQVTITRLDLAYDDFASELVSIRKAVEWYQAGGFGAGGRMPAHELHGDWLLGDASRKGRTLVIGSRQGGKMCRIYEKGKQLGDPDSPWVRIEVEWHNESRRIPYAAITNPGGFLSGAYDCLNFLDQEQSRIETQQRAAKVSFDRAMDNGRHLAGKLVNLALEVYQGDYAEVVEQLRRDGYPQRVEPFLHAVKESPEVLAEELHWGVSQADTNTPHLTRGERV